MSAIIVWVSIKELHQTIVLLQPSGTSARCTLAMSRTAASAHLKFLDDASHAMLASSPATSAHLRALHQNAVMTSKTTGPVASGQAWSCAGCGTKLIPGLCREVVPKKRTRSDRLSAHGKAFKSQDYECERCHAVTTIVRPRRRSVSTMREDDSYLQPSPSIAVKPSTEISASQGSNEKPIPRKRARGKRTSLQSMLAKQSLARKPVASGNFGLEITDLLKQ